MKDLSPRTVPGAQEFRKPAKGIDRMRTGIRSGVDSLRRTAERALEVPVTVIVTGLALQKLSRTMLLTTEDPAAKVAADQLRRQQQREAQQEEARLRRVAKERADAEALAEKVAKQQPTTRSTTRRHGG